MTGVDLSQHAEHFTHRFMQDLLAEATGAYWLRRANTFEAVGTPQCDQIALACRRHATLVPFPADDELIDDVLSEVA